MGGRIPAALCGAEVDPGTATAEKAEGAAWTEGGTKNHRERQNEVMAAGAG